MKDFKSLEKYIKSRIEKSTHTSDYKEEDVICIVWGVEDVKMRIDELKAILFL